MGKSGKVKISKVKRSNQKRTKLMRQGKLKARRHHPNEQKKAPKQNGHPTGDECDGNDMLSMVEKSDLDYLKENVSKHSFGILSQLRHPKKQGEKGRGKKRKREEEDESLELKYNENVQTENTHSKKREMLPIKTSRGLILRSIEDDRVEPEEKDDDDDDGEETSESKELEDSDDSLCDLEEVDLGSGREVSTADLLACREEVLNQRRLRIGLLCSGILESPEEKIKNFKPLLDLMGEFHPEVKYTVRKLAMVSLLEVFKDVLPTYPIKIKEEEGVKLKKATKQLRMFEQQLLKAYKTYLTKLEKYASMVLNKHGRSQKLIPQDYCLAEIAVKCLCELLENCSHFNFSVNIAQLLVVLIDVPKPAIRQIVLNSLRKVIKSDKRGEITLQIVKRINALLKKREHSVHAEILQVLLALRIKDINLDKEKEDEIYEKKLKSKKMNILSLSKKERKRKKHLKEVEKELMMTQAEENKQTRHALLTEVTKVVFMVYFRILKREPNPKLLSVTLEGLAKFSAVINLDFYHDLVDVLDELMESGELGVREQLHIVQTVFTILSGHGEALNIDPIRFYTHLYRNLLSINAGKSHSYMEIVLPVMDVMLIRRRKKISQQRLLAFTKRLSTLSLQVLHNGALGCLANIRSVLQLHKPADILLDLDKTGGQGIYNSELEDPEYCNASSAALWELTALQRHYHPTVRKYSSNILQGCPDTGVGALPLDIAKMKPEDLYTEFDPSAVAFNPAVPPPKKANPKDKYAKHFMSNQDFGEYCQNILDQPVNADFGEFLHKQKKNLKNFVEELL